jgi:hypothetical protein
MLAFEVGMLLEDAGMATIEQRLSGRADYSSFLVHLTRRQGTIPARRILRRILREQVLRAQNPYCLFYNQIEEDERENFDVVCFTEAPLHQIRAFLGRIDGRSVRLEPYGLVFTKDFIARHGGNPAFYINTHHQSELRDAALDAFYEAREVGFDDHPVAPLLPFFNIFGRTIAGGRYDFYWEREWKVVGDVEFNDADIVVGLCPADRIRRFEHDFPGIRFISPRWGLDEIVSHLREG